MTSFSDWLKADVTFQEIANFQANRPQVFSTGAKKPPPGMTALANDVISDPANKSMVDKIVDSPNPSIAAKNNMTVTQKGFNTLPPTTRKRTNIGDLSKVIGNTLGVGSAVGAPKSPLGTGSTLSNANI